MKKLGLIPYVFKSEIRSIERNQAGIENHMKRCWIDRKESSRNQGNQRLLKEKAMWVWYAVVFMSLVCEGQWVEFVVHLNRLNFIILSDLFYLIVCVKLSMCYHYFQIPIYWYQSTEASALCLEMRWEGIVGKKRMGELISLY